jgi:DNA-binding CsgD family transcriptional regulator
MAYTDDVLALVPLIYQAAVDPDQWQPFLEAVNTRYDGAGSVLHLQCLPGPQSGQVMAAVGVDTRDQQRYETYFAARNIWTIRGRDQLRQGAVLTGEDVCPNSELEGSEYYNDYLKGLGFYHALASVPAADTHTTLIVTTFRSRHRGSFAADDLRLQRTLTPHLQRAAQVHNRLASAASRTCTFQEVLEHLSVGVALLDTRRRPLFANQAAKEIVAARDGFDLSPDGPTCSSPTDAVELRRVLQSALSACISTRSSGGGALRLQRPSGRRPYEVLVSPLSGTSSSAPGTPALILFIADPSAESPADQTLLRQLHDLTASEARMAAALLQGQSLGEAADRLDVTRHTARWTVKQLLEKTETRSQGQLIATMLKGLARIRQS